MDDDMDTPGALAGIFELVSRANSAADAGDEAVGASLAHTAAVLLAALGVSLREEAGEIDEAAAELVAARDEARRVKDFARADALRDELVALGWTVEDTPSGTAIRR
jgi:cysteinyl-tRNA synthetase